MIIEDDATWHLLWLEETSPIFIASLQAFTGVHSLCRRADQRHWWYDGVVYSTYVFHLEVREHLRRDKEKLGGVCAMWCVYGWSTYPSCSMTCMLGATLIYITMLIYATPVVDFYSTVTYNHTYHVLFVLHISNCTNSVPPFYFNRRKEYAQLITNIWTLLMCIYPLYLLKRPQYEAIVAYLLVGIVNASPNVNALPMHMMCRVGHNIRTVQSKQRITKYPEPTWAFASSSSARCLSPVRRTASDNCKC